MNNNGSGPGSGLQKRRRKLLSLGPESGQNQGAAHSAIQGFSIVATAAMEFLSQTQSQGQGQSQGQTLFQEESPEQMEIRLYYEKYPFLNTLDREPIVPPKQIYGTYTDEKEFDIFQLHKSMLDYFYFQREERLENMRRELHLARQKYDSGLLSYNEKSATSDRMKKLEENIILMETNEDFAKYIDDVDSILKEYHALKLAVPDIRDDPGINSLFMINSLTFASPKQQEKYCDSYLRSIREKKILCLLRYLPVINKYIPTVLIKINKNANSTELLDICSSCMKKLETELNQAGNRYCKFCGAEQTMISSLKGYGSTKTVKQDNERFDTFKRTFLAFQGKQNVNLPDSLFSELDKYFSSHNMPGREEIQTHPLDDRGRRVGTNLKMMLVALKNSGNSPRYEDAHLICKLYWGWQLPDLSYLEEKILNHIIKTDEKWFALPDNIKHNFNVNVRLFKELRFFNYECYEDDFKLVADKYHNQYKKMWELMIKDDTDNLD